MMALSKVLPNRFSGYWGTDQEEGELTALAVRNGDVGTTGDVGWASLPVRGFTSAEVRRAQLRKGDLILTTSGNCGRVALIRSDPTERAVATNFVRVLRTNSDDVDPVYVFRYLQTAQFQADIAPFVRGATIKNLSVEAAFEAVSIPLPNIAEQRRIATILDHADGLRAKRRQVLSRVDSLAESVFHEMFGREATPTTVERIALRARTGPFGSQLLHSEFVGEGIAVLGLDNVVGNEFRWAERRYITPTKFEQLKRYIVHPDDVLISIMGTTGRCVVVPRDIPTAINTKHICAITPDSSLVEPHFLRAAFLWHPVSREYLRRQTKGSIMDGLNLGIIKAMPIPLPDIGRQREYTARVSGISATRERAVMAMEAVEALYASLESRAFRGEL